jgi:hypothetical protein
MTAQIHERLILDGRQVTMDCVPGLPSRHPRIVAASPTAQPNDFTGTTACWRRYVGSWELRNRKLYLVGLEGRYELVAGPPLFADWFSGVLSVPVGRQLHYVHMGFESVYEEELLIAIYHGIEKGRTQIDNRNRNFAHSG